MTPSYALGLFFIFLVSIIWSVASILVQYLYQSLDFDSPFILTYIGTSLFIILIPGRLIFERKSLWKRQIVSKLCGDGQSISHDDDDEIIIPWRRPEPFHYQSFTQSHHTINGTLEKDEEIVGMSSNVNELPLSHDPEYDPSLSPSSSKHPSTEMTECANSTSTNNENTPLADATNAKNAPIILDLDKDVNSNMDSRRQEEPIPESENTILSHVDHIHIAIKIAPMWFLSNYFYNLSLRYTSITSSTVLSNTGSVFTFLFALACGAERFTKYKLLGVVLAFTGSIITSIHDANDNSDDDVNIGDTSNSYYDVNSNSQQQGQQLGESLGLQLWGDTAGLISAIGYGGYTVLISILCPSDESKMSMQLLLGYIGLINMVFLSPIGVRMMIEMMTVPDDDGSDHSSNLRHLLEEKDAFDKTAGIACHMERLLDELQPHLTGFVLLCLVVKGLSDNVLADYLWARSIILTSATVATVGLGLTIPLALLSDAFVFGRDIMNLESIVGALFVLAGFIFVNVGEL